MHVASGRPYADAQSFQSIASLNLNDLTDEDWLAAFRAHPRIGERGGDAPETSAREQARVMQAPDATLTILAAENRRYEARFGHVFLIAARGRNADEVLAELRRRMNNDPAMELTEARRELARIAHDRLEKLVRPR